MLVACMQLWIKYVAAGLSSVVSDLLNQSTLSQLLIFNGKDDQLNRRKLFPRIFRFCVNQLILRWVQSSVLVIVSRLMLHADLDPPSSFLINGVSYGSSDLSLAWQRYHQSRLTRRDQCRVQCGSPPPPPPPQIASDTHTTAQCITVCHEMQHNTV